jgi:hypothetical protein
MAPEFPQSWRRKRLLVWDHLRMRPEDDPEARIRDLERPLADVARTSELGTDYYNSGGAYTSSGGAYTPPPLPPSPYGAPYPPAPYPGAPPQKVRSGLGAGWWLFAAIVVAMLIIGAAFAIYSARVFSLGSETRPPVEFPSVSGGGGEFDKAPGAPSVPGGGPVVETPSAEPIIPPPGEQVSVSGADESKTIACNENIVNVSGFNNIVTITGHCASVTVSGGENQVTVDSSAAISASGFDNVVTFHIGSPKISVSGSNVVQQG